MLFSNLASVWFVFGASLLGLASAAKYPFDETTLSAPDGSITAKFVSFGATMTELWVKDRKGKPRDVILGYDDNSKLLTDPAHPVFNPIVGRYANRIRNGTFTIPITKAPSPDDPSAFHIPTNDHDGKHQLFPPPTSPNPSDQGQVTLHGGILGWDRRNWTIVSKSRTSVTYKHVDNADEGFPGVVTVFATHKVSNGGVLKTSVSATATQKTPIMVTQHIYWNLDAFQDNSNDILNHHLKVDASRVIALDDFALPTGEFINVTNTPFDFRGEQQIGARWDDTNDLCGQGCQGYDHAWVYDKDESNRVGTTLWSDLSGIKLEISTNQPATQVYTSFWMNTPRKAVHGGPTLNYGRWSAVAIEQEGYLDAINTPEWGVDQIHDSERPFFWSSTYKFSTV